ncbi:MAG: HlyD family secretion protein [Bacteroidota bacterium]
MKKNKLELPSEELGGVDFIGTPPGWLLRSGISVVGVVAFTVIIVAYFIRYPDKIISQGVMTTEHPPVKLVAVQSGVVSKIYRRNNDYVSQLDTILYIRNSASIQDIRLLQRVVSQLNTISHADGYLDVYLPQNLLVGELQSQYARLQLVLAELRNSITRTVTQLQKENIDKELTNLRKLEAVLYREQVISQKELSIVEKEYQRSKNLHSDRVISDLDFEKSSLEFLRFQRSLEVSSNGLIQNKIRQNELLLKKSKLVDEYTHEINNNVIRLKELTQTISESLLLLGSRYVVLAEKHGTLIYSSGMHEKMFVSSGTTVASIVPGSELAAKFVKAFAPSVGIGKIKKGHRSLVKIDGFPYKEYGVIETEVQLVSMIPEKDKDGELVYEIRLPLSDTLRTNYGVFIPYQPDIGVICEIITEDRSILERIFNNFFDLIKNK